MKRYRAYQGSTVPAGHTRDQIEKILLKYGADAVGWQSARGKDEAVMILRFKFHDRMYRFQLHLGETEQDERRLMRVLFHGIKALLTEAEAGVLMLEDLLMAYSEVALPDGSSATVGDVIRGQLSQQKIPDLMAGLRALPARSKNNG